MNKAFTLIEILIVLVIISIISIFMIPYVTNSINDARTTRVTRDFSDIKNYVQSYYNRFAKESRQVDIGAISGTTLPLLEYTPFEFGAVDPLDYLDKEYGFKFTKDPWGTPYNIYVTSSTLPSRVVADFSSSKREYFLMKIFSLNRALFDDPGDLTVYHMPASSLSISFRYRVFFTEKVAPQTNLGNIRLFYSSSIYGSSGSPGKQQGNINLSTMSIGPIDESHRRTETHVFNAVNTNGLTNVEKFNVFLVLELSPSFNNNKVAMEIESLNIKAQLSRNGTPVEFYFSPFDGKVLITLISAGPDRIMNTSDDINQTFNLRLNI